MAILLNLVKILICCSKAACAGGMLSTLRDICENSVIRAALTCISKLVLSYMRTTNRSRFRMISSGMFTVHVW